MQHRKLARFGLAILAATALAGCGANSGSAVRIGTDTIIDYYKAKNDMARQLQQYLTGTSGNVVYTLVAINGPGYPIGALLASDNPADVESRACQLNPDELPPPEPWSNVPSADVKKSFEFSLNIPAPMHRMFKSAESSVGAGFTWAKNGAFELSQMSQIFLSREDLRAILARPKCAAALKAANGSQAVFVRGIVYGKETLTSSYEFKPNLTVKIMEGETGQFVLKYTNEGDFSLTENAPTPKFAIIARVRAPGITKSGHDTWTGDSDDIFTKVDAKTVDRIEAVRDKQY